MPSDDHDNRGLDITGKAMATMLAGAAVAVGLMWFFSRTGRPSTGAALQAITSLFA